MEREYYSTPKPSKLIQFFWKAAGADKYILERSTYSDHIKYACLGGIVIATGVMAAIAGGYAFYTIFSPKGNVIDEFKTVSGVGGSYEPTDFFTAAISMVFGVLWGLIIFNIDRFIVTSTGKGDGTEAITRQELIGALPRIIMGTILALTISKPVEIRMFKSEIDVELHKAQMEKQREYLANIDSNFAGRLNGEKEKIAHWQQEIQTKDDAYQLSIKEFNLELAEKPSGSSSGYGPDAKKKEENMHEAKAALAAIHANNDPLIKQGYENLKVIEQEKQKEINNGAKVAAGLDGLLERIKLAHEIAGFWISTFITLLFMAIELTPIFFKLMLIKSPYDYMEDNIKELIKAENGIQLQYNYYQDKNGLDRHLVTYHNANRIIEEKIKLIQSQKKLSNRAIDKWEKEQAVKIDHNVNDFITEEAANTDV